MNGSLPKMKTNSVTPADQMSVPRPENELDPARLHTSGLAQRETGDVRAPLHISGAMKAAVPAVLLTISSSPSNGCDTPKSPICEPTQQSALSSQRAKHSRPTLMRLSAVSSRFSGLMSRCMILLKCTVRAVAQHSDQISMRDTVMIKQLSSSSQ